MFLHISAKVLQEIIIVKGMGGNSNAISLSFLDSLC